MTNQYGLTRPSGSKELWAKYRATLQLLRTSSGSQEMRARELKPRRAMPRVKGCVRRKRDR